MELKPSKLIQAIVTCYHAMQPLMIWGPPGIGKSDCARQASVLLAGLFGGDFELRDVRAVTLDPVDLRGLPSTVNGKTHFNPPDFLPTSGRGILFLDELPAAPQLVQAACYQLILDRQLGDYRLPDGWLCIAAGNREQDGAVSVRMPSALRSRFAHVEAVVDLDDWCKWAIQNGIEPPTIAFMRFRPELLHKFDAKNKNERTFPCPRTWSFVSRLTAQSSIDPDVQHALFCGAVGEGPAVEYSGFLRLYKSLPNIDAILLNPQAHQVPTDPATQYAIAGALARKATDKNLSRVIQYLERMPEEFNVLAVKDMTARDSTLCSTPEFTTWGIKHQEATA